MTKKPTGRYALQPSIGLVPTSCLCPPKPETALMDWSPHPGFGVLTLKRDGETPEFWHEFCEWPTRSHVHGKWETGIVQAGPRKGEPWEAFIGGEVYDALPEFLTLGDIEEAVAEDPDHDWRLEIHGPMGGAVYQRHGCAQWVAIERLDGFA
jgi:hypothetical protein